jgi:predicted phosphodiesterase
MDGAPISNNSNMQMMTTSIGGAVPATRGTSPQTGIDLRTITTDNIGSLEVAQKLAAFRPFRAVYGNIDGQEIRQLYPQILRFTVDGAEVLMKHIGGYPGNYDPSIKGSILVRPPKLFISGHSHILKVKYDKTLDVLHINPGAAGIQGFHKVRTMVRFAVDGGTFKDLEVIELADR